MCFFFFNDTATTEIYTLSLHDALPISARVLPLGQQRVVQRCRGGQRRQHARDLPGVGLGRLQDRKSTRLNSSHATNSYAVFCLKKKNMLNDIDDKYLPKETFQHATPAI